MKMQGVFLIGVYHHHKVLVLFTLLLQLVALASCGREVDTENEPIIRIKDFSDGYQLLNRWHVVGPFDSKGETDILNIDYLARLGYSESDISFDRFVAINCREKGDSTAVKVPVASKFWNTGNSLANVREFFNIDGDDYRGTAYFGSLIVSDRDLKTFLHYSSNTADKIWLNNQLIASNEHIKKVVSYQQFIPVTLNRGENFLLIKASQNRSGWNMYARLEPFSDEALNRQLGLREQSVLQYHVFTGDTIMLNRHTPHYDGEIAIFDFYWNQLLISPVIAGDRWKAPFGKFPEGLYRARYTVKNVAIYHDFYKGNLHDSIKSIITEIELLETSENIKNSVDALIYRYFFLLENTFPTNRMFVSYFIQFYNILGHLRVGANPYHHTPGWHLRSYISNQ